MTSREFQDRLARRARRAGVALSDALATRLEVYYRLLATWNRKINLSGMDLSEITPEALDRLLIEPVAAARFAASSPARIIDVGSGGGSPAIPFALAAGAGALLMVESKTRKSVFLREAARAVGLPAVEVATARYEELLTRPDLHERHDLLTIRAVRVEPKALMTLQAFVRPGGRLLLFRGAAAGAPDLVGVPMLEPAGSHLLVEELQSHLLVLRKRPPT